MVKCDNHSPILTCEECLPAYYREQRRYEIARDVMAALIASGLDHSPTILAPMAVEHADALLKALEERTDGE